MPLRPDQEDLIARTRAAFDAGARSVLMQGPTGFGKTHTAAALIASAVGRGGRVLFLAHLSDLIEDTHARLVAAGVHAGFVQAGRAEDPEARVQVGSMQTLHMRGTRPPAGLVIIDECHRVMGPSVRGVLEAYPDAHLLGLSATPQRGDGQALGDVFEAMVLGPSVRWLTERGHLVPCDVLTVGGGGVLDSGVLAVPPSAAWQEYGGGERAIVFAASVAHAEAVVAEFIALGVAAAILTGETPRDERARLRAGLRDGTLRVLVGVGVFLEGWDCPPVSCVVLARGFSVTGAYLQAVGRGLRPSVGTGKTRCTVIDLVGAANLHGLPDEDRVWSLDGAAVRRAEKLPAIMRCGACLALYRPAAVCPRCGESRANAVRLPRVRTRAEKLEALSHLPQETRDARYLRTLEHVARTRIRLPEDRVRGWAEQSFRKRFGREPVVGGAAGGVAGGVAGGRGEGR